MHCTVLACSLSQSLSGHSWERGAQRAFSGTQSPAVEADWTIAHDHMMWLLLLCYGGFQSEDPRPAASGSAWDLLGVHILWSSCRPTGYELLGWARSACLNSPTGDSDTP